MPGHGQEGLIKHADTAKFHANDKGRNTSALEFRAAEGVETAEQVAFLLDQHCDEGHGFFFGHPMVADALTPLLQSGASPTAYPH